MFAPDLFPASFRTHHNLVAVYFEAAAVIIALVLPGEVLELKARSRCVVPGIRDSIKSDDRSGRNEPELGFSYCKCLAAAQ